MDQFYQIILEHFSNKGSKDMYNVFSEKKVAQGLVVKINGLKD